MSNTGAPLRLLTWSLLFAILVVDGLIFSPISLGLLYFVPLAIAALRFGRSETVAMAVTCALGRVLFGPIGDPLGLDAVTVQISSEILPWVNAVISSVAYIAVSLVLLSMGEQRRRIALLDRAIESDPLTGAGNRRRLRRLFHALKQAPVAVLAVDIDHFKRINDTFGHDAGDRVLQELTRRLESVVREADRIIRMGGEEFLVVLPGASVEVARGVAGRILDEVRQSPFLVNELEIPVTVSVGCASGPAAEPLLKSADEALYRAKTGGRDRIELA